MYYNNKNVKIETIDIQNYNNDKEFYKELWKKKYNIKLKTKNYGHTNKLISYIRNDKKIV
jgi:predicted secreted protein